MKLDQIRKRVGQMFIIGWGTSHVDVRLKTLIQDYQVGGVCLFDQNIENPKQLAELINEIQSLSKTPMFISIDQEGGKVARLRKPFTQFAEAADIAKTNSPKLLFEAFQVMAKEMKAVGINYDFAPVVDLNTNPKNPIINRRSFGADPETVSKLASGIIRGLQRGGVMACAKHFPGHGDTSLDSHKTLPEVTQTVDELKKREWIPFERVIRGGVDSIMTAHILNKHIDPDLPATLSKKTIDYLRKELRFQKIVITDDMEMKGISAYYPVDEASVMAIKAGCDIVLICNTFERQVASLDAVLKNVIDIKIPMKQIEASSERITKARNKYILPYQPVDTSKIDEVIGIAEHQKIVDQLTA